MFRFLFVVGVIYLAYRLFKNYTARPKPGDEVRGRNRNRPLDVETKDISDAQYEDIEEK